MKNNKKLIPELRFPEFENEGEWEIKTLSGICDITNGKANAQDHVDNGRYPLFDRSEVIKASDEFIFDCEAVIIPGEGMRFIPKYYEGKFNLHQRAYALKDFSCSGQFVYYSMLHRSTLLSQKAVQSTVLSLRLPILQDFPIEIPKKPEEQEKIASCLSSLDEVIEAHSQKLELLKEHKKGLLQNLFPQEGEKVPKVRFKEFEKDGEWVETTLENNCEVKGRIGYRGYTTQDLVSQGEGALVLGGKHIQNQLLELKDPTYLSWEKYYESPEIMVEVGNIIFSQRGTLGDCAMIDREIGAATINPSMVLIKNITCDARFTKANQRILFPNSQTQRATKNRLLPFFLRQFDYITN
jgi:type I restriction enzyme S subunit